MLMSFWHMQYLRWFFVALYIQIWLKVTEELCPKWKFRRFFQRQYIFWRYKVKLGTMLLVHFEIKSNIDMMPLRSFHPAGDI